MGRNPVDAEKMRALGIDYGSKRIGIALSDPGSTMAQPLDVIDNIDDETAINAIIRVINEYSVARIVVGLPKSLSGEIGDQAKTVLAFTDKLRENTDLEIVMWDERLSTAIAHQTMRQAGAKKHRKKSVVDKIAAAIILQGYLDSKRTGENRP
jgi:putative holliday junction resolvase